uniref:Uncharacterized protein n=1 Tax=Rhizophora mucronata TaxID=61149 RepID=A0A2P2II03_RHIMU
MQIIGKIPLCNVDSEINRREKKRAKREMIGRFWPMDI